MLGPARARHVDVHVAGLQPDPVHRRQVPDRVADVRVLDQLRQRRGAGGEVQQQRVLRVGRPVHRERPRLVVAVAVAQPALDRLADGDAQVVAADVRERRSSARLRAMTAPTRPRSMRSRRSASASCVVAGMITAPSFIAASVVSHSSTWLPSRTSSRMPRATPRRAASRRAGRARRQVGEGVARVGAVGLDQAQRGTVRVLGGEHAVEPVGGEVEGLGARPRERGTRRRSRCGGRAGSHAPRAAARPRSVMTARWHGRSRAVTKARTASATAPAVTRQRVVAAGDRRPSAAARLRRHAERVAVALHDEDGHAGAVQLVQPAAARDARAGAAGTPAPPRASAPDATRGAAGDPRAVRPAAEHERQRPETAAATHRARPARATPRPASSGLGGAPRPATR